MLLQLAGTRRCSALRACAPAVFLRLQARRHILLSGPVAARYIADVLAPSARLVLEVDGAYHGERTHADLRRDRVLAKRRHRVLRLEAALVLHEPALVIARIQAALASG